MLIKPSSDELIGNEFKSSILLYFTPQKTEKNQANCHLKVVYLGNEYETTISSHFGGQIRLHDFNLSNKYYVVVSPEVSPLLDNNSCIKGYKINSENIHSSKMYVMNLIITTNSKSEMTYNWNIEEIAVPTRSLPENTIIIYAEPESISFASFNKKFDCFVYISTGETIKISLEKEIGFVR